MRRSLWLVLTLAPIAGSVLAHEGDGKTTTNTCEVFPLVLPNNTDISLPIYGHDRTITDLRAIVTGTSPSITVSILECTNAACSATTDGGIGVTADGGQDADTSFTDAVIEGSHGLIIDTGACSGVCSTLGITLCYTRQVVQ